MLVWRAIFVTDWRGEESLDSGCRLTNICMRLVDPRRRPPVTFRRLSCMQTNRLRLRYQEATNNDKYNTAGRAETTQARVSGPLACIPIRQSFLDTSYAEALQGALTQSRFQMHPSHRKLNISLISTRLKRRFAVTSIQESSEAVVASSRK
jgi:hypothetical protein